MKTTKLSIGLFSSLLAMAAIAPPAPAQSIRGGGKSGTVSSTAHAIIYIDYDVRGPAPAAHQTLRVDADGSVMLAVGGDLSRRTVKGSLTPAAMGALQSAFAKLDGAGKVAVGADGKGRKVTIGAGPQLAPRAVDTSSAAAQDLVRQLDRIARDLAATARDRVILAELLTK